MIDRRPGLIVSCWAEQDVSHAVRFAREHGVLLSICGAGHNIAGNAVSDGGLMISFKNMKAVDVDPTSGRVRVEPGATLGDSRRGHPGPTLWPCRPVSTLRRESPV